MTDRTTREANVSDEVPCNDLSSDRPRIRKERAHGVKRSKASGTRPRHSFFPEAQAAETLPTVENSFAGGFSFQTWCDRLAPMVLASRSAFSAYLSKTIKLTRLDRVDRTTPTFFPIPVPYLGAFARMPAGDNAGCCKARRISKAIHVMIAALNYWYSGGAFAQIELQRRKPALHHLQLYQRLRLLIESDGDVEVDNLPSVGRRFPELIARISEISGKLTKLGASSDPYDQTFHGETVEKKLDPKEELRPFHDMDPTKIKVHGAGLWDATPFLDDDICMAYREPRSILHGIPGSAAVQIRDTPETLASLAHVWDEKGLLLVHDEMVHQDSFVRIFGAFKDASVHRQIGDRRGQNHRECKLSGPSHDFPSGCDLCELAVDPVTQNVSISISDRKDYYHQLKATRAKAIANTIGPAVPSEMLQDTKAFSHFLIRKSRKRRDRWKYGDGLFSVDDDELLPPPPGSLWVSFQSVLQGDHAGVEIATQAHCNLLKSGNLLRDGTRMVASRPLRAESAAEGLVIDDFYSISFENKNMTGPTRAELSYRRAAELYAQNGLLGSPQKDLIGVQEGRIIGAYLNGSDRATSRGMVTLAAPIKKRLALSVMSLQVAQLPCTSDSLHLCLVGGWVSLLGYRRPLMSILQESFGVVNMLEYDRDNPKLVPLTRKVAEELVLLSVLAPLAMTDLAVPFSTDLYCTDASNTKGAILKTSISPNVAEVLWKSARTKGAYSRLLSPVEAVLRHLGELEESPPDVRRSDFYAAKVHRPIAFTYDFIETFSGAAKISRYLSEMGFSVGPPIDLGTSEEFDMSRVHVVAWLTHMISEQKLHAFFGGPPCTTFSIMRRPALRGASEPFGYDPSDAQTKMGNVLAHRGGQLMYVSHQNSATGILETPYSSHMKLLPFWRILRGLPGVEEVRTDSCRFESPHLKSFRFIAVNASLDLIARRCVCKMKHVVVQGALTKGSATYTDPLARAIAAIFAESIRRKKSLVKQLEEPAVKGLENQLNNEVMLSSKWDLVKVWSFTKQSHINILEESSLLKLCLLLARSGCPKRFSIMVDSNVVLCATSKGRSSSRGLSSILRRVCAAVVAAGLYISIPFCPTRLNCSDDPTRDREIRGSVPGMGLETWDRESLFNLAALPKLKRWASNWARLSIILLGPDCLLFHDRSTFRQTRKGSLCIASPFVDTSFDSTKGFPGEGPQFERWNFVDLFCRTKHPGFSVHSKGRSRPCRWNQNTRSKRLVLRPLVCLSFLLSLSCLGCGPNSPCCSLL